MITVLETRDFFEVILNTRQEVEEYLSVHPEKESCRLIELAFEKYPFVVLEIDRGNFKYFENINSFRNYLKETDIQDIPKAKAVLIYSKSDDSTDEDCIKEIITPALTIYIIKGPYKSYYVNEDGIGSLEHHHLEYCDVDELIATGRLKRYGIE